MPSRRLDSLYPWLIVAASLILLTMAQGALYLLSVSLKPIAEEFDWPRKVPSLAYGLASFFAGLGSIYMAQLSERIGLGPIALFGTCMISLGAVATSFVEEWWQLYLIYGLLIGLLGNSCVFSPIIANTTRWFERRRGLAIGIVGCGQSLAGVVWPQIVPLVNGSMGWRTTYLWYGLACFALMLPAALVVRRRPPAPKNAAAAGGDGDGLVLGWKPGVVMATLNVAIIGCCIAMALPITHLVAYGTDLGHLETEAASLVSMMLGFSMISRLGGGLLADRIGGLRTVFLGSAIQAAMLFVMAFTESLPGLLLVSAVFGIGYGGIIPIYAIAVRDHFPLAGAARRIAVLYFFGLFAMALGSWFGGWMFDQTGSYRPAFVLGSLANFGNLLLLGVLIWRAYGPRARRLATT